MKKTGYNIKANVIFWQIFIVGVIFALSFCYFTLELYSNFVYFINSLSNKIELACGCSNYISFSDHPYLFFGLTLSGILMIIFFANAIHKTVVLKISTKKFIKLNLRSKKNSLSNKLKRAAANSAISEAKICEIKSKGLFVFCFGFLSPKICISEKLVDVLNCKELTAVLLHEKNHLIRKEPIKLFLVKAVSKILFFVPGLKPLSLQYSIFSELAADELATDNFKNKIFLMRALYKTIKLKEKLMLRKGLALPFLNTTNERIKKLTDECDDFKKSLFYINFAKSILFVFILVSSLNLALTNIQGENNQENGDCSIGKHSLEKQQCPFDMKGTECITGDNMQNYLC